MENNYFEKDLTSDSVKFKANDSVLSLAMSYKQNCRNCESLALDIINQQHVPALTQFAKLDTSYKFQRAVNFIRFRRTFLTDITAHVVYLVGATDFLICSVLNDELITTFQKSKDRSKIDEHFLILRSMWDNLFSYSYYKLQEKQLESIVKFIKMWNDMLVRTNFKDSLLNLKNLASDCLRKKQLRRRSEFAETKQKPPSRDRITINEMRISKTEDVAAKKSAAEEIPKMADKFTACETPRGKDLDLQKIRVRTDLKRTYEDMLSDLSNDVSVIGDDLSNLTVKKPKSEISSFGKTSSSSSLCNSDDFFTDLKKLDENEDCISKCLSLASDNSQRHLMDISTSLNSSSKIEGKTSGKDDSSYAKIYNKMDGKTSGKQDSSFIKKFQDEIIMLDEKTESDSPKKDFNENKVSTLPGKKNAFEIMMKSMKELNKSKKTRN